MISLRLIKEYELFHISNDDDNRKFFSSVFYVPVTILRTWQVFILSILLWNLKFLFLRNATLTFALLRDYRKRNLNMLWLMFNIWQIFSQFNNTLRKIGSFRIHSRFFSHFSVVDNEVGILMKGWRIKFIFPLDTHAYQMLKFFTQSTVECLHRGRQMLLKLVEILVYTRHYDNWFVQGHKTRFGRTL